ncbi:MAG TPA: FTR1 family protein [Alphaproteobacteria bacterium]
MLAFLIISFREGMEAFLIVAITLAYLMRTNRTQLVPPVYYGIGSAVIISIILGVWLESVADNPMAEGVLAILSGVLVGTFTIHMIRAAKNISNHIRAGIDAQTARPGIWASVGVTLFVTLMIAREGMETVLMISAASYDISSASLVTGVLAGLALAALMGYFWVHKSHLIHIGRFLKVSAIFLMLFSLQMILKGLHEFSETGSFAIFESGWFHMVTEDMVEEDSIGGQIIAYSVVLVPLAWLAAAALRDRLSSYRI